MTSRYLISAKWVEKWKGYSGIGGSGIEGNEHPGPIDNSELLTGSMCIVSFKRNDKDLFPESHHLHLFASFCKSRGEL